MKNEKGNNQSKTSDIFPNCLTFPNILIGLSGSLNKLKLNIFDNLYLFI